MIFVVGGSSNSQRRLCKLRFPVSNTFSFFITSTLCLSKIALQLALQSCLMDTNDANCNDGKMRARVAADRRFGMER